MYKIISSERIDNRNWIVTVNESGQDKQWAFKRREYLDRDGNPVYEVYPPHGDGLPAGIIGRRNIKGNYYMSNGYGMVQNITNDVEETKNNSHVIYILSQFYN